jgi:hypothetical protein
MKKFDEMLVALKENTIVQKSMDWAESIPDEAWDKFFKNEKFTTVKSGLEVDTHRWYELSVTVIEIYGRYLGIRHISNLFSESSSVIDIYHHLEFFEMVPVTVVSYTVKPV